MVQRGLALLGQLLEDQATGHGPSQWALLARLHLVLEAPSRPHLLATARILDGLGVVGLTPGGQALPQAPPPVVAGVRPPTSVDDAYFEALAAVLELPPPPVPGRRVWAHELLWPDRNVTRTGHLVMGGMEDDGSLQGDFFLHFAPLASPYAVPEDDPARVVFRLDQPDEWFAVALADACQGPDRDAQAWLRAWLRAHLREAFGVTYLGETGPIGTGTTVRGRVDSVAAVTLAPRFADLYPGYPRFAVTVTEANRAEIVRQALVYVVSGRPNPVGAKALASLGLVDGQGRFVDTGEFAQALLALVGMSGAGRQVVTDARSGSSTWGPWHLESVWMTVVAAVLARLGRLELVFPSGRVDAHSLDDLLVMGPAELDAVAHLAPPRGGRQGAGQPVRLRVEELLRRVAAARAALERDGDGTRTVGVRAVAVTAERVGRLSGLERALERSGADGGGPPSPQRLKAVAAGLEELHGVEDGLARARLADALDALRRLEQGVADPALLEEAARLRRRVLERVDQADPPNLEQVELLGAETEDLCLRLERHTEVPRAPAARVGPWRAAVVAVAVGLSLLAGDNQGMATRKTVGGRPARQAASPVAVPVGAPGVAGNEAPVTIAFAGDVHFEGPLRRKLLLDPLDAFRPIAPVLASADLTVANLETAVTERGARQPKQFGFRAPPTAFRALAAAGVDVVSLANNHGLDYGPEGLRDTLAAAHAANFPVVGIGDDASQAYAPYLVTIKGQRVAVLGATQVLDEHLLGSWVATDTQPGLASAKDVGRLLTAVLGARASADTVVVFLHWGTEGQHCPSPVQTALAHRLVEAGADIVVGGHAHRLQGAGRLGPAFVAYGLGNFAFHAKGGPGAESGVLKVTVAGRRIHDYTWTPARIHDGVPHPFHPVAAARALRAWHDLRGCTGLSP